MPKALRAKTESKPTQYLIIGDPEGVIKEMDETSKLRPRESIMPMLIYIDPEDGLMESATYDEILCLDHYPKDDGVFVIKLNGYPEPIRSLDILVTTPIMEWAMGNGVIVYNREYDRSGNPLPMFLPDNIPEWAKDLDDSDLITLMGFLKARYSTQLVNEETLFKVIEDNCGDIVDNWIDQQRVNDFMEGYKISRKKFEKAMVGRNYTSPFKEEFIQDEALAEAINYFLPEAVKELIHYAQAPKLS